MNNGKRAIFERLFSLIIATLFGLLILACGLLASENARLRERLEEEERAEETHCEGGAT